MQFAIIAYDGTDKEAPKRRLDAREEHLSRLAVLKNQKKFLQGGAILDKEENMIGSIMIMDFPSKEEFNQWLETEPYVVNKVWDKVEVLPCKVPPMFLE